MARLELPTNTTGLAMSRLFTLVTLLCLLPAAGCSYFRLPILQGNIVDYSKAEQLEVGMTPRQVEFLLGTPLIRDSFGSPRWDYVVYYRSPKSEVMQKNLSIHFENNVVSRIEGREAMLADWRKQRAAVKKASKLLDTPHPGQLPANATGSPTDPADPDQPHPVLPPSKKAVKEDQRQTTPAKKPASSGASQKPADGESADPGQSSATGHGNQTSSSSGDASNASSSGEDYPPDMTTIYK